MGGQDVADVDAGVGQIQTDRVALHDVGTVEESTQRGQVPAQRSERIRRPAEQQLRQLRPGSGTILRDEVGEQGPRLGALRRRHLGTVDEHGRTAQQSNFELRHASSFAPVDVEVARTCQDPVIGSITVWTRATTSAGNPPQAACSRTASSFSARYTQ